MSGYRDAPTAAGEWANVGVVLQVGPGLASMAPLLAETLHESWRAHPSILLALPPGSHSPNKWGAVVCSDGGWVSMLRDALVHLRTMRRDVRYVVSIIDDHCPLRRCDESRLKRIIDVAIAGGMQNVSFVTYEWPWNRTEKNSIDEDGRRRTWQSIDVLNRESVRFARVPKDFFRYNQCQPSLWNLEYYLSLCEAALAAGIDDPWSFEAHTFPDQPEHFVADYEWPSVHHGFLAQRRVNAEAVHYARSHSAAGRILRRKLIEMYCDENGRSAYVAGLAARPFRGLRGALGRCLRAMSVGAAAPPTDARGGSIGDGSSPEALNGAGAKCSRVNGLRDADEEAMKDRS